eukprot:TRINITY_DN2057_c0_g1_i3.p2 TRINITY_DN2057_c0_g1~~TRINITY_DN2057_c0_g1_i3.p2  ORF type:complete len:417 (+),score=5.21 TRINITY_DN2057_c0_g1_i3:1534-2784(+)
MTMKGGFGTCGMNVLPGLIPIVKGSDACNRVNYGFHVQGNRFPFAPGTMNPCGGGDCTITKKKQSCINCPPTFIKALNSDGSTTCAPQFPCTFFLNNPCGVGRCVNAKGQPGIFTCLCPFQYTAITRATDQTMTCILGYEDDKKGYYIVPSSPKIKCIDVANLHHIKYSYLQSQNSGVCAATYLTPGAYVITEGSQSCNISYFTVEGDTCVSIIQKFGLSNANDTAKFDVRKQYVLNLDVLNGVDSPNPNLVCQDSFKNTVKLLAGTLVCIELRPIGLPPVAVACTFPYVVKSNETCASLVLLPKIYYDYKKFFFLNPGLNCDRLAASLTTDSGTSAVDSPFTICLASTPFGAGRSGGCSIGRNHYISGDEAGSCVTIFQRYYNKFEHRAAQFKAYNYDVWCDDNDLNGNTQICIP